MSERNTRKTGSMGERLAVEFLCRNNYTILKTNYRVGRIGEIDIIAHDSEYICFIEVKTRHTHTFGTPSEAVTAAKQKKIRQIASIYLSNTYKTNRCVRFDVIEIILSKPDDKITTINLLKNAF
ncbi:MAG: hypothetical protein K0R50_4383 [Eubacterium sp.]|nr:hypothetical protein [Eubacterium sp.]